MDSCKAKLSCSLRWISGMLRGSSFYSGDTLQLLSSPYDHDGLNQQVVAILIDPSLYLTVFARIHSEEDIKRGGDFSSLLQSLARQGVYVLEDEARVVNHSVLAQSSPFREASHMAVMAGLMTLYTRSVITVQHVVKAVKRLGTFVASKDLPDGVNEGLLLWLNKVSEAAIQAEINERGRAVQVSDARQRRRNRLQLMGAVEPCIRHVDNICVGVGEGQALAALLIHYVPQSFKWADFHFSKQPLSRQEAEENVSKVIEFSNKHLPPPGFHLDRETLLDSKVVPIYEESIFSILALFFNSFEIKGSCTDHDHSTGGATSRQLLVKDPRSPESSCSPRGNTQDIQQKPVPNVMSVKKQLSLDPGDSLTVAPKKMPRTRLTAKCGKDHNLSSHSDTVLAGTRKHSNNLPQKPIARTNLTASRQTASETPASVAVFKAPVRDSVSIKQAKTLSHFSTPQSLNPQSSSSSLISQPDIVLSQAGPDRLITASIDSLRLQEQMRGENQKKCQVSLIRGTRDSRQVAPPQSNCSSGTNSASDVHTTSTSRVADVSANGTESWGTRQMPGIGHIEPHVTDDHSSSHDRIELVKPVSAFKDNPLEILPSPTCDSKECCPDQLLLKPAQAIRTVSREESEVTHQSHEFGEEANNSELMRSYTIEKPHTFASASAAGLPIIRSFEEHHTSHEQRLQDKGHEKQAHETTNTSIVSQEDDCKETNVDSLPNSRPAVLHLGIFPGHVLPQKCQPNETSLNVSPEVLELRRKAHAKSEEILAHLLATTKREQIMKQKIVQILLSDPNLLPEQDHEVSSSLSEPSHSTSQPSRQDHEVRSSLSGPSFSRSTSQPSHQDHKVRSSLSGPSHSTSQPSRQDQLQIGKRSTMDDVLKNGQRRTHSRTVNTVPRPPMTYSNQNGTRSNHQLQTPSNAQRAKLSSHVDKEEGGEASPPLHMPYTSMAKNSNWPVEVPFSATAPSQTGRPHPGYRALAPVSRPQKLLPDTTSQETIEETHNPWLQASLKSSSKTKQKEQKVRSKLEERERARKAAWENRKKTQLNSRAIRELRHTGQTGSDYVLQVGADSEVLHYRLTDQQPLPSANKEEVRQGSVTGLPAAAIPLYSEFLSHNGPRCYVKPQVKSNKKLIKNALCYVCLAGEANLPLKQRALAELEATPDHHVLVLFRDIIGFKFRGLYSYTADQLDQVTKIFGSGPKIIKGHMVSHLYKYNSGLKEFKEIPSRAISISVDAVTIHNEFWTSRKTKQPLGAYL